MDLQAGSTITFAPYKNSGSGTEQAYVDLYKCVGASNVDYILYQAYALDSTLSDAAKVAALTASQSSGSLSNSVCSYYRSGCVEIIFEDKIHSWSCAREHE
jgi:hypothetical protein